MKGAVLETTVERKWLFPQASIDYLSQLDDAPNDVSTTLDDNGPPAAGTTCTITSKASGGEGLALKVSGGYFTEAVTPRVIADGSVLEAATPALLNSHAWTIKAPLKGWKNVSVQFKAPGSSPRTIPCTR